MSTSTAMSFYTTAEKLARFMPDHYHLVGLLHALKHDKQSLLTHQPRAIIVTRQTYTVKHH